MKYIVYCTTCDINNFIYVGVHATPNPEIFDGYLGCSVYVNRPNTYKHSKTKFQEAVNRFGVKHFHRAIISVFDNEDDAYFLEADIVNKDFLMRSDVYNMALGGKGGNYNLTAIPIYQYDSEGNFI